MIILTEIQAEQVKGIYNGKGLKPVLIKNNLYILPERILQDSDFPIDILETCEVREVEEDEFIKSEEL